jgi:hypothetical protein
LLTEPPTRSHNYSPFVRKNTSGAGETGSRYRTTPSYLLEKQFTRASIPDRMLAMGKRYQKKSSTDKKREKKGHGPSRNTVGGQTTGVMGNMVGGFRRAVGSDDSKDSKGSSLLWTAVLVTAAIAIVAWNFAR